MPYINENVDVDIYVDVNEFLSECSDKEIKQAIEWLRKECYLTKFNAEFSSYNSPLEEEFINNLTKIGNSYYQLTNEEQELIEKISKRL